MMRASYKYELAQAAGVSYCTFSRWLKTKKEMLHKLGVLPGARLLPPIAVEWICNEYGIDVEPCSKGKTKSEEGIVKNLQKILHCELCSACAGALRRIVNGPKYGIDEQELGAQIKVFEAFFKENRFLEFVVTCYSSLPHNGFSGKSKEKRKNFF